MKATIEPVDDRSVGVRRMRLTLGDAWIEVSYGTGAAHGAALGRVYGTTDPLVQAQIRLRRAPVAHVCYLLVSTPRQGTGSALVWSAIEQRPLAMWFVVAAPDSMAEMPALRRFYARHGFAPFCENQHYLRRVS